MKEKMIALLKDCLEYNYDGIKVNIVPSHGGSIENTVNIEFIIQATEELFYQLINGDGNADSK